MLNIAIATLAGAAVIVFYAYFGYPLILWLLTRRRRTARREHSGAWPIVSITVPVYNEAATIAATLENLLALEYPAGRCQILVVSDASTDGTDDIVRGFAARGVELIRVPVRAGKTTAENTARAHLRGEVIVNTDASVRIDRAALAPLIAEFADESVGVASGRDVSVTQIAGNANSAESRYVGYEMWVRDLETSAGGIVGASGCFYAIRRRLHMELVPGALSRDFAAPLIAKEHGYRAVSVADAICYVPRTGTLRREFHRKVRTMTRGLETLYYKRQLLNPLRYGRFGLMLLSHKLVRWLVPWAVAAGIVAAAGAAAAGAWWGWVLLGGSGVALGVSVVAWYWPGHRDLPRLLGIPAYVVVGVAAGLLAWIKALRGELNPVWEPTRRHASAR